MKIIQFRQMEGGVYRILQACKTFENRTQCIHAQYEKKNYRKNYLLFTISKYRDSFDYILRLTTININ